MAGTEGRPACSGQLGEHARRMPSLVRATMERLRKREEFRAVAEGPRVSRPGFVLQALKRNDGPARFGFTVTRKIGNAVMRNRIRRRLREAVRMAGGKAADGTDYVLIARRAALALPFDRLIADLMSGFAALNRGGKAEKSSPS